MIPHRRNGTKMFAVYLYYSFHQIKKKKFMSEISLKVHLKCQNNPNLADISYIKISRRI